MGEFWKMFEKTAYFRVSWLIQDHIIGVFKKSKRKAERQSIEDNSGEIIDKVYNNPFYKNRKKK